MLSGKVWGTTTLILKTPLIEIHYLYILPNSQCSLHCHMNKWNGFMVQTGLLSIEVHKNDYDLVDVTQLDGGDFTTVKPGEYHRFVTGDEETWAWEVYYPETLSEDIIRKNCGSSDA